MLCCLALHSIVLFYQLMLHSISHNRWFDGHAYIVDLHIAVLYTYWSNLQTFYTDIVIGMGASTILRNIIKNNQSNSLSVNTIAQHTHQHALTKLDFMAASDIMCQLFMWLLFNGALVIQQIHVFQLIEVWWRIHQSANVIDWLPTPHWQATQLTNAELRST